MCIRSSNVDNYVWFYHVSSSTGVLFHIILTLQVQWLPHNETILASSGTDHQLHVWDFRYVYMHKHNYKHLLI